MISHEWTIPGSLARETRLGVLDRFRDGCGVPSGISGPRESRCRHGLESGAFASLSAQFGQSRRWSARGGARNGDRNILHVRRGERGQRTSLSPLCLCRVGRIGCVAGRRRPGGGVSGRERHLRRNRLAIPDGSGDGGHRSGASRPILHQWPECPGSDAGHPWRS